MSEYKELVARLRARAPNAYEKRLSDEAAAAIERLAALLQTSNIAVASADAARVRAERDLAANRAECARLRTGLSLLVADVQDYAPWQRPCYALEVAHAALATTTGETDNATGAAVLVGTGISDKGRAPAMREVGESDKPCQSIASPTPAAALCPHGKDREAKNCYACIREEDARVVPTPAAAPEAEPPWPIHMRGYVYELCPGCQQDGHGRYHAALCVRP